MKDQVITFAAICQAAHFVQHVSRCGQIDDENISILLNSIIQTSPQSTLGVYGSELINIKVGLELLIENLGDNNKNKIKNPDFTRYIISLINLERKLMKQPKQLAQLANRITATERQLEHYPITSETIVSSFASIYSDIISPLGARIQVSGEPTILKQTINQHKIRALLLAGIRAAVLWRQVGGKRRTILFNRTKIVNTAKQLLSTI
ncbi:MAG: high frequency lysogenization protein HflD [Litorilituus sp.]|jgi:high frequency lysogenization protein|nr:high frequency lysogenization protein HflD [Litorilituus sp.]